MERIMKKRTLIRLGALALALTLAACDGSSGGSSNNKGEGYEPLQGTWRSDCLDYEDTPQRITLDISGDEAISTFDIYQDPHCTQKLGTFTITYRYSVGENLLTVGGMEAKQLDVVVIDDPDKVAEYPREY